ncbi:MAG: hypothetical protein HYX86_01980 [Chloroflexi bacterium]|nr:hypothetical protein [Chloroflexota bacterium]
MLLKRQVPLLLGGLLLIWLGLCGLTSSGRAASKAFLLLPNLFPDFPLRPLRLFTAQPIIEEIFYPTAEGTTRAFISRPGDSGDHPAVIVFFGLNPDLLDPRLRSLVDDLARAGFVVMFPYSEGVSEYRLKTSYIQDLVDAFRYLEGQPYVRRDKIGYGGFSLGASLSFVAAGDDRISERVSFVNFFGGYYDAYDLLLAVTTHTAEENGERVPWEPHPEMTAFVQLVLLNSLESKEDYDLIYRDWYQGQAADLSRLTPQGQAVYELVRNRDPELFPALFAQLPEGMRREFKEISPRYGLDKLQAPLFILHDRGDPYIPVGESRRLAVSLPSAQYTETDLFQHVVPRAAGDLWTLLGEIAKLWGYLYQLLLVAE